MRTLALAVLYYLVFTPLGRLARILHDPLRHRWDDEAATYWTESARA